MYCVGMTIFDDAVAVAVQATGLTEAQVRAVLVAAAPVLQAEAWDEGAEAVVDDDAPVNARNPYYV